jgi:hypothetical protein
LIKFLSYFAERRGFTGKYDKVNLSLLGDPGGRFKLFKEAFPFNFVNLSEGFKYLGYY